MSATDRHASNRAAGPDFRGKKLHASVYSEGMYYIRTWRLPRMTRPSDLSITDAVDGDSDFERSGR
jgi:hypothetical protein